ncbi:MAG: toxin-antitoxin system HicB family antitoxin [Gammaproteobacteria bacterium]|nr:toxin-antitoxin system HicB family antitoxin [Gammaproteobacteria bacterium]
MKRTSTYPLRLPTSLKAAVAEISQAEGTSMNQFVAMAVAEKVSAMRTAEFFAGRRDAADLEPALRILRREGGQPPSDADALGSAPSDGRPRVAR